MKIPSSERKPAGEQPKGKNVCIVEKNVKNM
jgi:hypothetical protein